MSAAKPTLAEVMTKAPIVIQPKATMAQALNTMTQHGVRHLPVVKDGSLVGLISERELRIVENMDSVDSAHCLVEDFLNQDPYAVDVGVSLGTVAREMASRKVGSAVVTEGGTVVGVFTTVDALRVLADLLEL